MARLAPVDWILVMVPAMDFCSEIWDWPLLVTKTLT